MTYRIPKRTLGDRLLAVIGKKRAISMPADAYKRYGPYVVLQAKREPFWRALTRARDQKLPDGWFYPDDFL